MANILKDPKSQFKNISVSEDPSIFNVELVGNHGAGFSWTMDGKIDINLTSLFKPHHTM